MPNRMFQYGDYHTGTGPWPCLHFSYDKYSKKHRGRQWSFLGVKKGTFQAFFMLKTPFFPGAMRFLKLFRKTKVLGDMKSFFKPYLRFSCRARPCGQSKKGRDTPGLSAIFSKLSLKGQQGAFVKYFSIGAYIVLNPCGGTPPVSLSPRQCDFSRC